MREGHLDMQVPSSWSLENRGFLILIHLLPCSVTFNKICCLRFSSRMWSVIYFIFTVCGSSQGLGFVVHWARLCSSELIAPKLFWIILNNHYKACVKGALFFFHCYKIINVIYFCIKSTFFPISASSCTGSLEKKAWWESLEWTSGLICVCWSFPWLRRIFFLFSNTHYKISICLTSGFFSGGAGC